MTDFNKKITEALNSLDNVQHAEANPWLYLKIRNKLAPVKETMPLQLAWRLIAVLAIVIVVNLLTLRQFYPVETTGGSEIENLANEYTITLPQTY